MILSFHRNLRDTDIVSLQYRGITIIPRNRPALAPIIPICHKEFGAATEYTRLLVIPPGHLFAALKGSCDLKADRILALVTLYPPAHSVPIAIDSPTSGLSCRSCLNNKDKSWSDNCTVGSRVIPNSTLLLLQSHYYVYNNNANLPVKCCFGYTQK